MTLYELVVPGFVQMLEALSAQLDKGASMAHAKSFETDVLMSARLAPDMHTLSSQVQYVCIQAMEAVNRLRGHGLSEPPQIATLEEAKQALAQTIAFLRSVEPPELEGAEQKAIELKLPNGMTFDLDGAEYVRSWAVPQFYFHLVAAYAILRHNGVDLGKGDYVPHMFRYVRGRGDSGK